MKSSQTVISAHLLVVLLMSFWISCGRRPPVPNPANPSAAGAETSQTAPGEDQAQLAALLNDLTQAVRKFAAEHQRAPTSLDELVTGGALSSVPQAPPGKKFVINKNLQVVLTSL